MVTSLALALDFGGTKAESALIDDSGRVVAGSRFRAPTGRDATSEHLARGVVSIIQQSIASAAGSQIVGAGIGSAGPINRAKGLVSPLNVPGWRDYPLRQTVVDTLADRGLDIPVTLQMDGVAITMAEHWVGAARGIDNVMGMVISTGIGGGLIVGGRVVTGTSGNAGHIGHVEVAGMTGESTFGNAGALEAIASGPNTVAWARRQGFTGTTGEDLAAAHAAGDEVAIRAIQRTGQAVGQAICTATALLDLEMVAIGGGFSQSTPDLFETIRETISHHHFAFVRKVRVLPSALSGTGPLVGAGALIHRASLLAAD
ncbi:ROK family protein [Homoserinimonas sp. OAct 916]|uniref:ROK family protein n=1 Tax=Homoserinimonas sp. OAct 916 TaxID=2211450 RepID=UPI000DBE385F|nr:ROK family protein [Homoserinimonas sp. OAct 916]